MPTDDLIKWWEDNLFENTGFQKELATWFDEGNLIDEAFKFGEERLPTKFTDNQKESMKKSWKKVIPDKADDIVSKNQVMGISELSKITDLTVEGQERITKRIDQIVDTKSASELFEALDEAGKNVQTVERVKEEIREKRADIKRPQLETMVTTGMKLTTVSRGTGLTVEQARTALVDAGYELDETDHIKKR